MSTISSTTTTTAASSTDYSRMSGMVSGLDTEAIVEGMVIGYQNKVDSLNQDKQDLLWKQESYEEVMTDINSFMDEFYDVLKPEDNILSNSGLKTVSTYSNLSSVSRYAEIMVGSDAASGSHTIDKIEQIATSSTVSSSGKLSGMITGTTDLTALATAGTLATDVEGKTFSITLDGVLREITIDTTGFTPDTSDDATELASYLETKFDTEFGQGRITASIEGDSLSFGAENSVIQVVSGEDGSDFLSVVGIENSSKNILNLDGSMESVFGETEEIAFTINDIDFTFENTSSLRDIMDQVNKSDANVKMSYSTMSDTFTMEAEDTGGSSYVDITNTTGSLFGLDSHIKIDEGNTQNGQDAKVYLDGSTTAYTRSSNIFTIDGTSFSLKEATDESIEYRVENNTDVMYEKIVSYVDSFNELYAGLKDTLSEKVELDYDPLTDAQKDEMTDSEIELWDEKAKSGTLRNDAILSSLTTGMRSALYNAIDGTSLSFSDIGIENSDDYSTFELVIDENTLRSALSENPEEVMELFNKEEDISYSATLSSDDRSSRYDEVGFGQRVSDILKSAVGTTRNSYGYKGSLVEKIGINGDSTENSNLMKTKLETMAEKIEDAIEAMEEKVDYYWDQFTYMETVLSQLNSQSEALYGMFSY
jgi:flagellar hook-associated protein 2